MCEKGNEDIVKYLVKHKADVNKKNKEGKTALDLACEKKDKNMIKHLLHNRSKINIESILSLSNIRKK